MKYKSKVSYVGRGFYKEKGNFLFELSTTPLFTFYTRFVFFLTMSPFSKILLACKVAMQC